jgi:hypothetical protein
MERRRKSWYAVLEVPPSKRAVVGRRKLRKTLKTPDKHVAEARLGGTLASLARASTRASIGSFAWRRASCHVT